MSETSILSYADYAVLSLLLIVSACIGLYFSLFGGKQETNNDYLLAGKNMSIFPTAFSLMASFISPTILMGLSAEMYLFGTSMAFMNLGFTFGPIIASYFFVPIYFKTGVLTPYEYLEKRFGNGTRRILGVIFLLQNVLFSGISLYAPALALSVVTNIPIWTSVICVAAVGTFYSTIGGMKAVIWTDVYQAILMYTCLFSIIIKGCLDLGGIQAIFNTAFENDRFILPTFKLNFSTRYTMWSIFLQSLIMSTICYAGDQSHVQRQLTLKTLKRSVISSLLSIPMIVTFQLLCCLCGIIFYAYFQACDPVTSSSHPITSYDQLMPYFIISTMREYPGLPGLCITGIFSVSLSTISASINAMAAVTYQDILRPLWPDIKRDVLITKFANFVYGVLSALMTVLIASMGNLIKATILVLGMVAGPSLAVFLLAALTTTANEMGTNVGVVAGFLSAAFVTFLSNDRYYPTLPLGNNCSDSTSILGNVSVVKADVQLQENASYDSLVNVTSTLNLQEDFPLSFMWISPLSLLVCFVTGYFGSCIISHIQGTSKHVPPELLSPLRQRFCKKDDFTQKDCPMKDVQIKSEYSKKMKLQRSQLQRNSKVEKKSTRNTECITEKMSSKILR